MQNPLQVTYHDLVHNQDVENIINEKFEKLNALNLDITKCHVILEKQSKHHQKGNMACVRLDLKVPHFDDIIISEKCSEDNAALKSAVLKIFKNGQLQLREAIKRRQDVKRIPLRDKFADEVIDVEE